MDNEILT